MPSPGRDAPVEEAERATERERRDREATSYDRLLGLRLLSRFELPATLRPFALDGGARVVEVGAGTGRVTLPLVESGAQVIALDHSRASLRVLATKLPADCRGRVVLIQGDATRIPVVDAWATHAVGCQVVEHLPSERLRRRLVHELSRVLKPGGRLALSGYRHYPGLERLLPREGRHSGAIFFHRFERQEFQSLLDPSLEIERLTGILLYIWLAHCRKRTLGSPPDGAE